MADARRLQVLNERHEQILRAEVKKPMNLECFDCMQKVLACGGAPGVSWNADKWAEGTV